MMKKNLSRNLVWTGALVLLLCAAIYAWFSGTETASDTGGMDMVLETAADGSLMICGYPHCSPTISLKGFHTLESLRSRVDSSVLCSDVHATPYKNPLPPPLPEASTTTAPDPTEDALKAVLQDKKLSILGDSISTFVDYSDSTAVNDTLGGNAVWYYLPSRLSSADQTWWKQAADKTGMEVLVNNAWSGSSVTNVRSSYGEGSYGYNTRPQNLHDNTLENNLGGQPIPPDIVAVYMGTNDLLDGKSVGTDLWDEAFFAAVEAGENFDPADFAQCATLMIYKITQAYPGAEIFCFNNPVMSTGSEASRAQYNALFQAIAARYGCQVVDLYGSPISSHSVYTQDGIHPTAMGMDIMTEAFLKALSQRYLPQT